MEKKTMTIVCVAVVAVVAIAAVAFFMMNNNEKDYNAQELADKFVKDYDGTFGNFVVDNGDANEANLSYKATQQNYKGEKLDATRGMKIKIVHFETKDKAAEEFEKYITSTDAPYLSKNGSKGETMVTQVSKLGMADDFPTVLNGTKNVKVTAADKDKATLKDVKASDYGADQIYVLYASYLQDDVTKQQYSQFSMVMLDGKNLVIINQSSKDEYSMYYNVGIDSASQAIAGEKYITVEDFEKALKNFCKAF